MSSGLRSWLVAAAACGMVVVVGALSAGLASGAFSNFCQPGWQPGAACQLAAPIPGNPGRAIQFLKIANFTTGSHVVISFTNSGCPVASTPIDVYAVFGLNAQAQQPFIQVGTIAATGPSKTNRISFAVPKGPDPPYGVAQFSMSFSTPPMNCYPPGYSGTWILGPGESNGCAPHTVGSLGYKTGETVIRYTVSGISRKCGPVGLSVAGKHLATLGTSPSRQSGHAVIRGRHCEVNLQIQVRPGASNTVIGKGSDGRVFYAHGDVTGPDGERLGTGDELCTGENGAAFKSIDADVEGQFKLHVGPGGALWAFPPGAFENVGIIDVHDTHVRLQGGIEARHVVIGLGHGLTVTLTPPVTAPTIGGFGPGEIPFERLARSIESFDPFSFGSSPFKEAETLQGWIYLISPPNFVFDRAVDCTFKLLPPTQKYIGIPRFPFVGASGRVEFRGGLKGQGEIAALGDITAQGRVDFRGEHELSVGIAFRSLGAIKLLGTG
jgi:hypothetical protein